MEYYKAKFSSTVVQGLVETIINSSKKRVDYQAESQDHTHTPLLPVTDVE